MQFAYCILQRFSSVAPKVPVTPTGQEEIMKIPGLVIAVLGWLIAMLSTQLTSGGLQLAVAFFGFVLAAAGLIRFMAHSHIESRVWKSNA
jgi:hypothetical protein